MKLETLKLNQKSFKSFGRILEPLQAEIPEVAEENLFNFFVIFKEFSKGWQIGYLEQIGRYLKLLECHPTTPEVFIPLSGKTVLVTSVDPEKEMTAFELDKPVVLNRGIWHGVISISKKSEILIAENEDVTDIFQNFTGILEVSSKDQSIIFNPLDQRA